MLFRSEVVGIAHVDSSGRDEALAAPVPPVDEVVITSAAVTDDSDISALIDEVRAAPDTPARDSETTKEVHL